MGCRGSGLSGPAGIGVPKATVPEGGQWEATCSLTPNLELSCGHPVDVEAGSGWCLPPNPPLPAREVLGEGVGSRAGAEQPGLGKGQAQRVALILAWCLLLDSSSPIPGGPPGRNCPAWMPPHALVSPQEPVAAAPLWQVSWCGGRGLVQAVSGAGKGHTWGPALPPAHPGGSGRPGSWADSQALRAATAPPGQGGQPTTNWGHRPLPFAISSDQWRPQTLCPVPRPWGPHPGGNQPRGVGAAGALPTQALCPLPPHGGWWAQPGCRDLQHTSRGRWFLPPQPCFSPPSLCPGAQPVPHPAPLPAPCPPSLGLLPVPGSSRSGSHQPVAPRGQSSSHRMPGGHPWSRGSTERSSHVLEQGSRGHTARERPAPATQGFQERLGLLWGTLGHQEAQSR